MPGCCRRRWRARSRPSRRPVSREAAAAHSVGAGAPLHRRRAALRHEPRRAHPREPSARDRGGGARAARARSRNASRRAAHAISGLPERARRGGAGRGGTRLASVAAAAAASRRATSCIACPATSPISVSSKLLFPRARVVHCQRDELDTALVLLRRRLGRSALAFGASLPRYRRVHARASPPHGTLAQRAAHAIFEMSYETLIADPESQVRARSRRSSACPGTTDCLRFHDSRRATAASRACAATHLRQLARAVPPLRARSSSRCARCSARAELGARPCAASADYGLLCARYGHGDSHDERGCFGSTDVPERAAGFREARTQDAAHAGAGGATPAP